MTTSPANQVGNSEEHELLTITEAADLLRTPVATLRYWRNIGYGPDSFRVGRGVRYWRHDILDWLHYLSSNEGSHAARAGQSTCKSHDSTGRCATTWT